MLVKSPLLIAAIIFIITSITTGDTQNGSSLIIIDPGESNTIGNNSMIISNPGNGSITATLNYFNTKLSVCNTSDVNNDGTVDIYDLTMVSLHYGESPKAPYPSYDINKDGKIDKSDMDLISVCFDVFLGNDISRSISSEGPIIKTDITLDSGTGKIINQVILNIQALVDPSLTNAPKNIQLYVLDHIDEKENYSLLNNRSYFGKPLKVDMKQRGDFPFEDYNNTIFITSIDENFTNDTYFLINLKNQNQTIDAWGQPRQINFLKEEDKIEITMERTNKSASMTLYIVGVIILGSYIFIFWYNYCHKEIPFKSDMFAVFNSFSFLFFVTLVIAGVRDYLPYQNCYALLFTLLVIFFVIMVLFTKKKNLSQEHKDIIDIKKENETLKLELKDKDELLQNYINPSNQPLGNENFRQK